MKTSSWCHNTAGLSLNGREAGSVKKVSGCKLMKVSHAQCYLSHFPNAGEQAIFTVVAIHDDQLLAISDIPDIMLVLLASISF